MTTDTEAYPAWLWQIVDDFDRWAIDRLPMVQDMVRDAVGELLLPSRTEEESEHIANSRLEIAQELDAELKRGPCRTKKSESTRQKKLARLRVQHFPHERQTATPAPELPSLTDKITTLACMHDVMIEQDASRKRRKGWAPVAPAFDRVAQEIEFATYFVIDSVLRHDEDRNATGSCQLERYWGAVQKANLSQATNASDTLQASEGASSPPVYVELDEIDPAAFISKKEAMIEYGMPETNFDRLLASKPSIKRCRAMKKKNGDYATSPRRLMVHRDDLQREIEQRKGKKAFDSANEDARCEAGLAEYRKKKHLQHE